MSVAGVMGILSYTGSGVEIDEVMVYENTRATLHARYPHAFEE